MPGRIYTDVVTIGDISVYNVSSNPDGVLQAQRGSLAIADNQLVYINTDGAATWKAMGSIGYFDGQATDIYVSTAGDDDTGDGSVGNPYATIERAWYDVSWLNGSQTVIHLVDTGGAVGSPVIYAFPAEGVLGFPFASVSNRAGRPRVRISGDDTLQVTTGTITTDNSNEADGWVLDVAGAGWAADQFRTLEIEITSGGLAGTRALIYENDGDTLFADPRYTSAGYPGNPGTVDFKIVTPSCAIELPGDGGGTLLENIALQQVDVVTAAAAGTRPLIANGAVRLDGVRWLGPPISAEAGCRLVTDNTYLQGTGDDNSSFLGGMVAVADGASWRCGGMLVIDGLSAAVAGAHVSIGGHMDPRCCVVFRELGTHGITLSGARIYSGGDDSEDPVFRFADCDQGILADSDRGIGSSVRLSGLLHGGSGATSITGSLFVIRALQSSTIDIGSIGKTSTATGSGGEDLVTANNSQPVAWGWDGAEIRGMTPDFGEYDDPGDTNNIFMNGARNTYIQLEEAGGAEARTLRDPFGGAGERLVMMQTSNNGGSIVVTADSAINQAGNTVITFNALDDFIELVAVDQGSNSLEWRVVGSEGVTLS